jgi:hypothetical protein
MSNIGLPDPLGLFGERTDLLGRTQKTSGFNPLALITSMLEKENAGAETRAMPTPNDEDVRRQRRRSVAQQRARSGRASTIFTEGYGLGG